MTIGFATMTIDGMLATWMILEIKDRAADSMKIVTSGR
jgi:hypothetical protein